jgi:hypothetical protein
VVMTDVRQMTASLVLSEDLDGRFYVRNAEKELIAELYKPRGRRVELGVEAGTYEVRAEIQKASLLAKTEVTDGARVVLEPRQFGPVAVEATRRRGDAEPLRLAVDGRNRISLRWGMWRTSGSEASVSTGVDALDMFAGLEYTRYVREDLSIALAVQALGGTTGASVGPQGAFSGVADVVALPVVVRWNPLKTWREQQAIKPFVAAGIGPVFGSSVGSFAGGGTVFSGANTQATTGGHFGAGVDFHVARSFAIGVNGGYNWMVDFSQPVGARDNYSGPEFGVSIGWLFGRGRIN